MKIASGIFTREVLNLIREAIKQTEKTTSAEIRVFIEDHCKEEVLDHAVFLFEKLGMFKTQKRNGVLIYLAVADHKFAVIGDEGIHQIAGHGLWKTIEDAMLVHFRISSFSEGIIAGVKLAGEALKEHFPYDESSDLNELSDDVIFKENGED
jgi:uncharacterized membrane protein